MKILKTCDVYTKGITCLVYGESGRGKTTLAGTLEGKTLIISIEGGLLSLGNKEIDYVEISGKTSLEKMNHIKEVIKFINKSDYNNIFIDSLSELNQIVMEYHFDLIDNDKSKTLQAWGDTGKTMKSLIRYFRDLNKFNVVMTALSKVDKDEIGRRFIVPQLTGQLSSQAAQFFDEVFYYDIIEKDEDKHRVLYTQPTANICAKDRSGKLNRLVKPHLGNIFKEIKG